MNKYFSRLAQAFIISVVAIVIAGFTDLLPFHIVEAARTCYVQTQATQLYSSVSSGATSIRLRSFENLSGDTLTMDEFCDIGYGTLSPGTAREEAISFTGITANGDGTVTLTGVTRGLRGHTPYGTGGTAQIHYVNSYFVISNGADFYYKLMAKDDTATVTAIHSYSSTTPPRYDFVPANHNVGSAVATTSEFASLAYVNAVATSGSPNGTESVKGLWEGATALEQASSTILGDTSAGLAMQSRYATDTPQSGCASGFTSTAGAGCSVIATLGGKIRQTFLDIFTTTNTWSGPQTYSATTTFSGNMVGTKIMASSTAGSTITGGTLPQPVSLSTSTNRINPADANDLMFFDNFHGFAVQSGASGANILVQTDGVVSGFSGLTAGATYYVQDTAGTIGTSVGTYEMKVGIAISTTEIKIERGYEEYVGSASFSLSTSALTSCTAMATSTSMAKSYIVKTSMVHDSGSSRWGVAQSIPMKKSGANNPVAFITVTDSGPTVSTPSATISMSGNIVTLSGSGPTNTATNYVCSGTLYMYR